MSELYMDCHGNSSWPINDKSWEHMPPLLNRLDKLMFLAFLPFVVIVFGHLNTWHTLVIKNQIYKFLVSKFLTSMYIYPHRYLFLPSNFPLNFPYILFSKLLNSQFPYTIHLSSFAFTIPNHFSPVGIKQFPQY